MLFKDKGSKKGLYIGTAGGLVLFALLGFFPSAIMGGYIGIKLAELIVGAPAVGILPYIFAAFSMIGAVIFTGLVFVLGGAIAGWIVGTRLELKAEESKA
jgi:hypothetical protein